MSNVENLVGTTLSDRYMLLEKIGTGGMAVVYKAHDKVLDRDVAIKILRESYENGSAIVENFIKEARSSASLVHPNVVSVYDVCAYNGLNYMVMELVDGITLKEYIKQNPRMPWQEACDYAIQIAQGIQAAHERGIIHRDIKPQNIIMAPGGVLKVTDFGIAKAMENDKSIAGGTALGSVHYISPEQARGGYTDFRSDIYSLGIVLYEMLAGRVPFDGDDPVSVALMHIEEEAINVKCVNLDVPADLAYVTMKAMDREQGKRYQNTQEMLEDLRAVLADEPLPSMEGIETETDETGSAVSVNNENSVTNEDIESRGRNTRVKNSSKKKSRKKRAERNSVVLALSTVAAIILVAAGVILIMFKPFSKTVPDFRNMTLSEAYKKAEKSGYKISSEIEYAVSDSVAEDYVITQFPEPGAEVPRTEPVKLVVSLGSSGGNIEVPNIEGMNLEDAVRTLSNISLNYSTVMEYDDKVEEGKVIRQTPVSGTHLNTGDTVTIHYSIGADPGYKQKSEVIVPTLTGYTLDNASSLLTASGLSIGSVSNRSSAQPAGTVINQSPAPGSKVKEGDTVSIIISNGAYSEEPVIDSGTNTEEVTPEPENTQPENAETEPAQGHMYTVKIPADAPNDKVNVKIIANGRVVHDAVHSKTEGQVTVEISESGNVSIQAYIDGAKVMDKTVTF